MPLVGGADLNGNASGDPTDLWFNRPYTASPTGLLMGLVSTIILIIADAIEDVARHEVRVICIHVIAS
eukprot:483010-Pleurochrysis_carterae.AAC.1